jgi:hypothetical protein
MTTFNPLEQRGIPIDDQLRSWSEQNVQPYDPEQVDPYTRCRVILMNGIEVESIMFGHQFARHTDVREIKEKLAMSRRIEQQQQTAVNWLIPAQETTLEVTLGYEQVAVDLTAWLARNEPDPYARQTLEFGLLEDFDHLYRYANLYEMLEGKKAERIVDRLTEVMPGRPTLWEHRHPSDDIRCHTETHSTHPQTKFNALTIVAAEQQTMNFYMTIGNRPMEPIARGLYAEIKEIEEQHVSQYESLLDPAETWFEQLVWHEMNECYLYHSFMQNETDQRIRALWELHLNMEITQLQIACDLMRRYEGREPEEIGLPTYLPEPVTFEPNKEYVRRVLAEQVEMTTDGTQYGASPHARYEDYQSAVNADGAPSEQVIEQHRDSFGHEYRIETEGPHPIERLRESQPAQ